MSVVAQPAEEPSGQGTTRIDYLSDTWFQLADEALSALPGVTEGITVAVRVTGDEGRPDVAYRLVLGPDQIRMIQDQAAGDVRLTMPYRISAAIAQGLVGAQRAFLDGEIQLGGDTTAILGYQSSLAEIEDRLAELRAQTRF